MDTNISQYAHIDFLEKNFNAPNHAIPNGPITGNGDIGLTIDTQANNARIWIAKNDFWCYKPHHSGGGMKSVGFIKIVMDDMISTDVWQDVQTGQIGVVFKNAQSCAKLVVRAPHGKNIIFATLECVSGVAKYELELDTLTYDPLVDISRVQNRSISLITKSYTRHNVQYPCKVSFALDIKNKNQKDTLTQNEKIHFFVPVVTNNESDNTANEVMHILSTLNDQSISAAIQDNDAWWANFWSQSAVKIDDHSDIEKYWYYSQYVLACCCDKNKFAPGIFGNFITSDKPAWGGDYHLNYNHEAPFWGLYSSNHMDEADTYHRPIIEYIKKAQQNAKEQLHCSGLYSKVGIGPKGYECSLMFDRDGHVCEAVSYWGQKSNAIYAGINFIMRYFSTMDDVYLKEIAYPYLKEVGLFWVDYLKFEDGRYVDYNDCIHENSALAKHLFSWAKNEKDYSDDFNPILTLALLRTTLSALIFMCDRLNVDTSLKQKWEDILHHLSAFPEYERNGKRVFRYTEKGLDWCNSNSLGVQPVYPAGAITLDSDKRTLETALNTYEEMHRWSDYNAFPTFFTAGVRLGYDPDTILTHMSAQISLHGYENGFIYYGGGGIECCSAIPSTINDMFVQNYNGIMRIFPVWNKKKNASFKNIRTYGAFLVSSEVKNGEITHVHIHSEKGEKIRIISPWKEGTRVLHNNVEIDALLSTLNDTLVICFDTKAYGEYILTKPML